MKKLTGKNHKGFVAVALGLLACLLIGQGLIYLGKHYAANILNELVQKETSGVYRFRYADIHLNLLNKKVSLEAIRLLPDSVRRADNGRHEALYDISIERVDIALHSVWSIYADRKLLIRNIRILNPSVYMLSAPENPESGKFSRQMGQLHSAIQGHLEALKVDQFQIESAALKHHPSEFSINGIQFLVENFFMDSIQSDQEMLTNASITLEVNNQQFSLADSVHQITFDGFKLSTHDSLLVFKDVKIRPRQKDGLFGELPVSNNYDVDIPELRLRGIDYARAYEKNELSIHELNILNAGIFIKERTAHDQPDEQKSEPLAKMFTGIFPVLDIQQVRIENTQLDIATNAKNLERLQIAGSDITMIGFHLDTGNHDIVYHKKYFDEAEILIQEYTYQLPDSIHLLKFDRFRLSTRDSLLHFKHLKIAPRPTWKQQNILPYINFEFPDLWIKGIDYQSALLDEILSLEALTLTSPKVFVENAESNNRRNNRSFEAQNLYQLVEPYFSKVDIDRVRFQDAEVAVAPLYIGSATTTLHRVRLSKRTRSWSDLYGRARVNAYRLTWSKGPTSISGARVDADLTEKKILLEDWKVVVRDSSRSIDAKLDSAIIHGLHPDSLFAAHHHVFDTLALFNPKVTFDIQTNTQATDSAKAQSQLPEIVRFLLIQRGVIKGTINDSTHIAAYNLNSEAQLDEDKHLFRLSGDSLLFQNNNQRISSGKIRFDDWHSHLTLNDVFISTTDGLNNVVFIPTINSYGLQQKTYWNTGDWVLDSLIISDPLAKWSLSANQGIGSTDTTAKNTTVRIGKVSLIKAKLDLMTPSASGMQYLSVSDLTVALDELDYPRKALFGEEDFLHSSRAHIRAAQIHPSFANGDSLMISQLLYDSQPGLVQLDSIFFKNNRTDVHLARLHMTGWCEDGFFEDQMLAADSLILSTPIARLRANSSSATPMRKIAMPGTVQLSHVAINDIQLSYEYSSKPDLQWNNGQVRINGLNVQDTLDYQELVSYIDDFELSGKNFTRDLPDNYVLTAENYLVAYPQNQLVVNRVKLQNQLTPESYSDQLKWQKDWFNVSCDKIRLSGINWDHLLKDQLLDIKRAAVLDTKATVYRDKNVPFPEDQLRDLPQQMLLDVDQKIRIDTLRFTGAITYREKQLHNLQIAEIRFNDLDATLAGIRTMGSSNRPMTLAAEGKLLDSASFKVRVNFNMEKARRPFQLTGYLDTFSLNRLNSLLIPIAQVDIKKGVAERVDFEFNADREAARGIMRFRYDNLKVRILDSETMAAKGFDEAIKTFFANTFIIKHKNPSFIFLKKGTIFTERDKSKSIFNYWGKALLSGVVSSVGIQKSKRNLRKFDRTSDEESVSLTTHKSTPQTPSSEDR